jgi:Domain of unknown function (DUF4260)
MKSILKLEETVMFFMALLQFHQLQFSWGWFAILFLSPDLGMLGYLAGPKAGAFCYNLTHHKGLALVIYAAGSFWAIPALQFTGILLFAHSSFDRILGYGLKYNDQFHHTHLGMIGKTKAQIITP